MSALIKKETQMVRPLAPKTKGDNKAHGDEPKDKKAKYTISMEGEFDFVIYNAWSK